MDITLSETKYYQRIKNYNKFYKRFNKIKENQCLTFGKKNKDYYEYYINNNKIFLKENIGAKSKYGLIFLTSTNFSKNIAYATKIMVEDEYNHTELILSKKLSDITFNDLNPHFLLVYKYFICNNKDKDNKLPLLIRNYNYYISINELADGNLKDFLISTNNPELILNTYQQILLSILSFHYHTGGVYHRDCHYKNFLYHKIKKGGYFHYKIFNKDIYIENKGYIWMIWDFGLAKTSEYDKLNRLNDYFKINRMFKPSFSYQNYDKFVLIKKIVSKLYSIRSIYKDFYNSSDYLLFKKLLFKYNELFPTSYNKSSFIINKKKYIIKKF